VPQPTRDKAEQPGKGQLRTAPVATPPPLPPAVPQAAAPPPPNAAPPGTQNPAKRAADMKNDKEKDKEEQKP
jgi:ribosomal protein L12E/L44/L45/RPP1/RPP2